MAYHLKERDANGKQTALYAQHESFQEAMLRAKYLAKTYKGLTYCVFSPAGKWLKTVYTGPMGTVEISTPQRFLRLSKLPRS